MVESAFVITISSIIRHIPVLGGVPICTSRVMSSGRDPEDFLLPYISILPCGLKCSPTDVAFSFFPGPQCHNEVKRRGKRHSKREQSYYASHSQVFAAPDTSI